jgi:3-oxoacyl-[acyl-carrier protein] reductase
MTVRGVDGQRNIRPLVGIPNGSQRGAMLDVNLKVAFLCTQATFPVVRDEYAGCIVNTSSIAAVGNIGRANYSLSKAGVIGLTKTLAWEWTRYGLRVNGMAPGGTK